MQQFKYLIIGGGIAGTTCAETLRGIDKDAVIGIVSNEPYPLYSRVAVSKENYLMEKIPEAQVLIKTGEWYEKNRITLLKNTIAAAFDPQKKEVVLQNGGSIAYEKLLIAVGTTPRRWTIPGSDKKGLHYVRTFDDGKAVLAGLKNITSPLMVGGGFIAFELCDVAVKRGLKPTVLIREPYYWEIILDEESGMIIEDAFTQHGITIVRNELATEVLPGKTQDVAGGVTTDKGRTIKADFIAVCIGTMDMLAPFRSSGLAIEHGVVADEYLRTNLPDVWTAGDCAEYNDVILGERVMMGNWANAMMHGRIAAMNMAGTPAVYRMVSSYPTTGFGLSVCFIGNVRKLPDRAYIYHGSRAEKRRVGFFIKENRIVGATLLNANADIPWIVKLISARKDISPFRDKLADTRVNLKELAK